MVSSMKIHFCDLCNESVPQSDIDQGRAVVRKGRIVCRACDRAMSHAEAHTEPPLVAADAIPRAPRASSGAWIGLAALAGAIAVFVWSNRALERLGDRATSTEASIAAATERARAMEGRLDAAMRTSAELASRLRDDIAEARAAIQAGQVEQAVARGRSESESARLTAVLDGLDARVREQSEANTGRWNDLKARIARNEQDQQLSVERLSQLESGFSASTRERAPVSPEEPAWTFLLEDLASAEAGTRWQAVANLGDTKDPNVLPHVFPMLRDPDVFVRMAAARVLGDVRAPASIGPLIDALEDREAPVREAAYSSLRAVTGKEHAFDPLASDAERERRVKVWREWWKREQESTASAGAPPR